MLAYLKSGAGATQRGTPVVWAGLSTLLFMGVFEGMQAGQLLVLTPAEAAAVTVGLALMLGTAIAWLAVRHTAHIESELMEARAVLDAGAAERNLLRDMMELLQAASTREELCHIMGLHLGQLLPGLSGSLYLFSASRDVVELLVEWGQGIAPHPEFLGRDCWALRLGKPYGCNERLLAPCQHIQSSGELRPDQGSWCFPMLAEGETLGVLHVQSPTAMTDDQRRRAQRMAERLALPVASLRLKESLRNQSIRDTLTGVFNRRYMEESLAREIKRAERKGTALSVVMLDLDKFKVLNDTYGHEVGDDVLGTFGRFLGMRFRSEDVICRFGGEEFVLLLPDTPGEEAAAILQIVREAWHEVTVNNRVGGRASATFSAGVAAFPGDGNSGENLLTAADAALYRSKARGRDCITRAGEVHRAETPVQ